MGTARQRWLVLFAGLAGMAAGCQDPAEGWPGQWKKAAGGWGIATIGTSVAGRPIEMYSAGRGRESMLILATIHGNESAGTPLLKELMEHLSGDRALTEGRRILIIPVANPDGYAKNIRHNVRGIDLNRNFPAENWQTSDRHGEVALSEPESVALHRVLTEHKPAIIISIHQPLVCIDYDGPGKGLADAMAAECDLPVKRLGGRPGSLGSYAGESLNIPIITVELPDEASQLSAKVLWDQYGRMLLAGIAYPRPLDSQSAETTSSR